MSKVDNSTISTTIKIFGMHISGTFKNEMIIKGSIQVNNMMYSGTFDDSQLLHGDNCSMKMDNREYIGNYSHGVMNEGRTLLDGQLYEQGIYTFTGEQKLPHLIKGTRYTYGNDPNTLKGSFNKFGDLINGVSTYRDIRYQGVFHNNILVNGVAAFKNGLNATYKINSNREFIICITEYNGSILEISKKQLIYICCSGAHPLFAHRFYKSYLSEYTLIDILRIKPSMFQNLSPENKLGVHAICESLSKYSDYNPL